MYQTLTLTEQTVKTARVALMTTANEYANDALRYIELGWADCAAQFAEYAFHNSRAWYELAFPAK